jgi:hypothetical protein
VHGKLGHNGERRGYPGAGSGEREPRDHLRVRHGSRPGHDRAGRPARQGRFQLPAATEPVTPEGTSGSTPLWGGVIALADQYAHHDLGFVNPALYRIGRSPSYHKAFHDVTTGNNYVAVGSGPIMGYQAGPGWDPVTGWGSPDAQVLIPLLARFASSSQA